MNRLVPLLAFLLVLSGCAAPAPTGTPAQPTADAPGPGVESTEVETTEIVDTTTGQPGETTTTGPVETTNTETDETTITTKTVETTTVESERLPTNESAIYDRVAGLVGIDAAQPAIQIVDDPDRDRGNVSTGMAPYERLLLDVSDRESDAAEPSNTTAYYSLREDQVRVLLYGSPSGDAREMARLEHVLAHEYAHAALLADEGYRRAIAFRRDSTESRMLSLSLNEGPAMYVTDAYGDRYVPEADWSPLEESVRRSWNGSEYDRYSTAPYLFGHRYFEDRLDSPGNLTRTYDTFPETTEQLIHGYDPGAEPPATLTVSVDGPSAPTDPETDATGELFVRSVLGAELPERRAATAAAGWGNDRIVDLGADEAEETSETNRTSERNYAWVLRWDDEGNATEFERAFADYLDARGDRVGEKRWRDDGAQFGIRRVSEETVAVVFGNDRVVRGAEFSAGNGSVTIRPPSR